MLGNLILEMTNAPGTASDCNLLGATAGRLPFGFWFPSGSQCFYVLSDGTQAEWGIGTYTAGSPNKLSRTTVLKNSAGSTARLNFLGETKIYNETPAERELWLDNNGSVTVPGSLQVQGLTVAKAGGAYMTLQDTSAASDQKYWDFLSSAGTLWGRAINDVYTVGTNWLSVARSGTVVTAITLAATNLALNGSTTVNGALNVNGNLTFSSNLTTTNAITAGYLHSTLDANVDRNLGVGGNVSAASMNTSGNLNVAGSVSVTGNLGAAYIGSSGSVDGSYLYSRGDGRADGSWTAYNLTANNQLAVTGQSYLNGIVNLGGRIRIGVGDNGFQANTHGYYVTINGSTDFNNAANFIVSGTGRGAYAFEFYWGASRLAEIDTGGSLTLRGNVSTPNTGSFGAVVSSQGLFQVAPNYYLQRGGDGAWRFVEAGTINCTIDTAGNISPRAGLIAQNIIAYGDVQGRGRVYAADNNMWMGYGGNGRVMLFNDGAYWNWGGDYALEYYRADRGPHFIMRNDGWIENRLAGGAGQDNWYKVSDERTKRDIVPATAGLSVILRLIPINFIRKPRGGVDEGRVELGFSAQQLQEIIPEAVREFSQGAGEDALLAVADGPIVAALVNGMKELHQQLDVAIKRIIQLESRAAA